MKHFEKTTTQISKPLKSEINNINNTWFQTIS